MKRPDVAPGTPIVILTGAGISQESGLATFRDADGLWARNRIEDVATPEAFKRDPARVQAFYNARRRQLLDPGVQPNAAHAAIAELQRRWSGPVTLVTQNVDDLHERGGSTAPIHMHPIHMHGELLRARCLGCQATHRWTTDLAVDELCPACRAGRLRPDVVWFGEMPMHMDRIEAALDGCGLFLSIGTSGQVHPAAGFVAAVRGRARTVELNLDPTGTRSRFDEAHHGPATQVVPAYVAALLAT